MACQWTTIASLTCSSCLIILIYPLGQVDEVEGGGVPVVGGIVFVGTGTTMPDIAPGDRGGG